MSSLKSLVSGIVDYAGLFPPASLPLDEVIANYQQYLDGDFAWMLARLVLPIAKTAELESDQTFINSKHRWRISALVPPLSDLEAFDRAFKEIQEFNRRHFDFAKAAIDNIEVKTPTVESVKETAARIPDSVVAFLEIPHAEDPAKHIAAIADAGRSNVFAKIRTGGVKQNLIPSSDEVARFITACAKANVGMKATAGLHHPVRGQYRLTYDPDAELGTMFGFLNVFAAAAFAYSGQGNVEFLKSVLCETDDNQFQFSDDSLTYRQESISSEQLKSIRETKLATFGSCSFTEPTSELADTGLL